MNDAELKNRFSTHAPTHPTIGAAHDAVRSQCLELASMLNALLVEGHEKSLAITNLEQVMFWSNASIARNQKLGAVPRPPTHSATARTFKECTKEELSQFVTSYPTALEVDVLHACDPPLQTYNDFSDGKVWPESVVAKVELHSAMPDSEDDDVYFIPEGPRLPIGALTKSAP